MIDKTGTLTLGRPVATNLDEADASVRALLLALARASRHPLSEALTRDLTAAGVTPVTVEAIRETPGFGVEALWNGRKVTLGRPAQPLADSALATQLAIDGAPALTVRFADALRPDAADTIAALRQARSEEHTSTLQSL